MKKQQNFYKTFNSIIIIWTLLLSFIITSQAKPIPANSVFYQDASEQDETPQMDKSIGNNPVYFEQNNGQFNEKVKFFARGTNGYSLFLTSTEAVYVLRSPKSDVQSPKSKSKEMTQDFGLGTQDSATAVFMKLVGAYENTNSVGLGELSHKTNYFKGKESNWRTHIPNFKQVRMENIYDGIDLLWNGNANGMAKYDFVISEEASLEQIKWEIEGAKSIEIDEKGSLLIKTEFGTISQPKPVVYRETDGLRERVGSKFEIKENNTVGITVGENQIENPVVFDESVNGQCSPICYSTFLGGSGSDSINAIQTNNVGEALVAGTTDSPNFPTNPGTFNTNLSGQSDGFITKFNSTGSNILFSTYIGSDQNDGINDMKQNFITGEIYITGETNDSSFSDFPVTVGAIDTTHNGAIDAFTTILNESGNVLVYSSYLGGDNDDIGNSIVINSGLGFFVAGTTKRSEITAIPFPTTIGAFDETSNGGVDGFVSKINPDTSTLEYSTFIGGNGDDAINDIDNDNSENVYITGTTNSSGLFNGYPTTQGSFDTSHNGGNDAFVTKLNAAGSNLVYSGLIGGNSTDFGYAIKVDSTGNTLVTGDTSSSPITFPITSGAFDQTYGGNGDIFVSKINPSGTNFVFVTYLGGSQSDGATSIDFDFDGNIYIGGRTASSDFPITPDAYNDQWLGNFDGFIARFNSLGSQLTYSSFFSGGNFDGVSSIVVKGPEQIHFAGSTQDSPNGIYPTTVGSYDITHNGLTDGFVTNLKLPPSVTNSAPYDFDGDSKTDISIFRPDLGQWWYLRSSDSDNRAFAFGSMNDKIVPGDYTGDGITDIAFWRVSTGEWFILRSEDSSFYGFPFGASGDIPAPGDYDGDGITDAAVYRPSNTTWYISNSSGGTTITPFGINGDVPTIADYDGDGKDDIAIYRPSNSQWWLNRSSAGVIAYQFGQAGDQTVQGDYTGDGKADVAFWRPSNGSWFILRSEDTSFFGFPFGSSGDIPTPGDFDGDGKFDAAVFRSNETNWYINGSTSGVQITPFGLSTDKPVPNAYVYD